MQERLGCLMYATTSTRADIAYPVHQLCKCMHKPTPALLAEVDHVLSYLSRTASLGLTYSREHVRLNGFADRRRSKELSGATKFCSWTFCFPSTCRKLLLSTRIKSCVLTCANCGTWTYKAPHMHTPHFAQVERKRLAFNFGNKDSGRITCEGNHTISQRCTSST